MRMSKERKEKNTVEKMRAEEGKRFGEQDKVQLELPA